MNFQNLIFFDIAIPITVKKISSFAVFGRYSCCNDPNVHEILNLTLFGRINVGLFSLTIYLDIIINKTFIWALHTEPLKWTGLEIHYTFTNFIRTIANNRFHKQPSTECYWTFERNKRELSTKRNSINHREYSWSTQYSSVLVLLRSVYWSFQRQRLVYSKYLPQRPYLPNTYACTLMYDILRLLFCLGFYTISTITGCTLHTNFNNCFHYCKIWAVPKQSAMALAKSLIIQVTDVLWRVLVEENANEQHKEYWYFYSNKSKANICVARWEKGRISWN